MKLLGFDDWFEKQVTQDDLAEYEIARVTAEYQSIYVIRNEHAECNAEVAGNLLFNSGFREELPVVGDFVLVKFTNGYQHGMIYRIFDRKNILKRKKAGKVLDPQPIASNLDYAFVLQALDHGFNLNRMERSLVVINDAGITPVILLSKSDRLVDNELDNKLNAVRQMTGDSVEVHAFSSITGDGLHFVTDLLKPELTVCFIGPSGVGKTTLINNLLGENRYETQDVRESDSKGRHTTTRRQLVVLPDNAMVIDTPGMRELGIYGGSEGLKATFSDIETLSEQCRFSDCTHTVEPGCAVIHAVENKDLSRQKYDNYMRLRREKEQVEMSIMERRKRDKKFGKLYKAIKKSKKKTKR
jgi:ribosome biogenesis GTPase / thiamine phosphate phosphatase